MKPNDLIQAVKEWDIQNPDDSMEAAAKFDAILQQLEWFGENEWCEYVPTENPPHSSLYMARLADWVGNVETDADRQLLLEYARYIAFFSRADFQALYRTAFSGVITRWVIEQEALSLETPDFQRRLEEELHRRTWYCPVTDSMQIVEFYHANHIVGTLHRPSFAPLTEIDKQVPQDTGSTSDVVSWLKKVIAEPDPSTSAPSFKRLVLLEDFVGTGTQSASTLLWAATHLELPILFVPLVICAPGVKKLTDLTEKHAPKARVATLLKICECDLLGPRRNGAAGIQCAERMERLACETFAKVAGGSHTDENLSPYSPFGFKQTGASFVSYSNTPNNTLPLVHHRPTLGGWHPLFPRSARV